MALNYSFRKASGHKKRSGGSKKRCGESKRRCGGVKKETWGVKKKRRGSKKRDGGQKNDPPPPKAFGSSDSACSVELPDLCKAQPFGFFELKKQACRAG